MTIEAQESRTNPQRSAIVIWRMMSLGPIAFFLTLLAFGFELLAASRGWLTDLPSDLAIFGTIFAVIFAEIAGVTVAYVKRRAVAGSPFESHAASAIQTFWIMLAGFAVSVSLCLMLLMIPSIDAVGFGVAGLLIMLATLPILFIWKTFRVVRGLRDALKAQASGA